MKIVATKIVLTSTIIEQESGTVGHILWHCRARALLVTVVQPFNPASVHCTLLVHLVSCLYRAADH